MTFVAEGSQASQSLRSFSSRGCPGSPSPPPPLYRLRSVLGWWGAFCIIPLAGKREEEDGSFFLPPPTGPWVPPAVTKITLSSAFVRRSWRGRGGRRPKSRQLKRRKKGRFFSSILARKEGLLGGLRGRILCSGKLPLPGINNSFSTAKFLFKRNSACCCNEYICHCWSVLRKNYVGNFVGKLSKCL